MELCENALGSLPTSGVLEFDVFNLTVVSDCSSKLYQAPFPSAGDESSYVRISTPMWHFSNFCWSNKCEMTSEIILILLSPMTNEFI